MNSIKRNRGFAMAGLIGLIIGAALLWWGYSKAWDGIALVAGIIGGLLVLHGLYKMFAGSGDDLAGQAAGAAKSAAGSGAAAVAGATAAAGAGAAAVAGAARAGADAAGDAVQSGASAVGDAVQSGAGAVSGAVQAGAGAVAGAAAGGVAAVAAGARRAAGFVTAGNAQAYRDSYPSNFAAGQPTCVNCGNRHISAGKCQSCNTQLFS